MTIGSGKADAARRRYVAAAHAMQTGVAYVMEKDPSETTPKHLRVGVNSAMVDHGALAKLLIEKGIITEDEYFEALAEIMEAEAANYEKTVQDLYGSDRIKLG